MKLHVQYPLLQSTNDQTQRIQSLDKKDTTFSTNYYKSCSCKVHYIMYHVCVHMYSCTCMDTNLHYIMCKYIHFLHMSISKQEKQDNTEKKAELENNNIDYEKKYEPDTIENEHMIKAQSKTNNECESNKRCDNKKWKVEFNTNIFHITDTLTDYSNPYYVPMHSEVNNKQTVNSSDFNIYEYFSHVLQTESFTDVTTCNS